MFVKEMGKKEPKGIKVGMTRDEALHAYRGLAALAGSALVDLPGEQGDALLQMMRGLGDTLTK